MEINGLDLADILVQLGRRQRRYLHLLLNDVETAIGQAEEYEIVRKLILDNFNDYTRSIVRILVGDPIEGLNFR